MVPGKHIGKALCCFTVFNSSMLDNFYGEEIYFATTCLGELINGTQQRLIQYKNEKCRVGYRITLTFRVKEGNRKGEMWPPAKRMLRHEVQELIPSHPELVIISLH
jgi:hypothetical protein